MQDIPINTMDTSNAVLDIIFQMKINSVMNSNLITAHRDKTLKEIQHIMKEKAITGVPITDDNNKRLLGIVSMDDIINALEQGYINDKAHLHMTRQVIVLESDMPLSFAITYFDRYRFHRFPVLNKHKELVGIISSRDISAHLLQAMNRKLEHIEEQYVRRCSMNNCYSDPQYMRFQIIKHDFENAGHASTEIKKALKNMGVPSKIIRRVAIATYELEINIAVHSWGGEIIAHIQEGSIEVTARDMGPGIPSIEDALTEGFSTANEWIRSMGFGAGMGLPNARRVSDDFSLSSSSEGTEVRLTIQLHTGDTNET